MDATTMTPGDGAGAHYSTEAIEQLVQGHAEVDAELAQLLAAVAENSERVSSRRAKEFLLNGVGRRLRILRRGLHNVFSLFPPSAVRPIETDNLDDAQISLHAFVINLYGLFDNLAWAFVWRHGLELTIDRRQVGMFSEGTKQYLPHVLRSYVSSPKMVNWSTQYLKNYRDALAHRIPLYIPPASYSEADAERFAAINREELECMRAHDWERLNTLQAKQHELGTACAMFMHSFDDSERSTPIYLHPQMLADAKTVIEACTVYLAHWHERGGARTK